MGNMQDMMYIEAPALSERGHRATGAAPANVGRDTKADPLNPRVLRLTRLNHPLNHVAWSSVTASAGRAPVSAGSRGKGEGSGEAIVWLVVGFCVVDFWWCSL